MPLFLQVEPIGNVKGTKDVVFVDAEAIEDEPYGPDDIVKILTRDGRTGIARIGEPIEIDAGTDRIRVGRALRSALKVSVGQTVQIEPASVEPIESMSLAPLSNVSGVEKDELARYLKESFISRGKLINSDTVEYTSLPGQESGTGFRIIESEPGSGIVDEGTEISVEYTFNTWGTEQTITFEDIGGLDTELKQLRELIEYPIRFPDAYQKVGINPARGVILFGPPGTGKTRMTRAISNELNADFHYVSGPSIIGTGYGESEENLRDVFNKARRSLPSIILIDEIDAIAPRRDQTGSFSDLRIVAQLLELLDGLETTEGVMVVATTNRIDEIDPALRRPGRFDREVFIGPPDAEGRKDIFHIHTRGMLLEDGFSERIDNFVHRMYGFTGADIRELTREAGVSALRRTIGSDEANLEERDFSLADIVVTWNDFEHALRTVQPSILRGPLSHKGDVSMDDVGGLKPEKRRLSELISLPKEHPETFVAMDIDTPPGILLVGPSGSGKTLLAQAMGRSFEGTFLQVDTSDVFSEWLGQSEKSIKQIFRIARRASPSIVLIDNLDTLTLRRGGESDPVADRVLNQLIAEIDGVRDHDVSLLATTDRPEEIDGSLLTPTRFGETIELGLPDGEARREILSIHLRNTETELSDSDLQAIADRTGEFTPAELESLCNSAKLIAVRETDFERPVPLTRDHLVSALDDVQK